MKRLWWWFVSLFRRKVVVENQTQRKSYEPSPAEAARIAKYQRRVARKMAKREVVFPLQQIGVANSSLGKVAIHRDSRGRKYYKLPTGEVRRAPQ